MVLYGNIFFLALWNFHMEDFYEAESFWDPLAGHASFLHTIFGVYGTNLIIHMHLTKP